MLPQFEMQLPVLTQFCPQVGIEQIYSTQPRVRSTAQNCSAQW